MTYPSGSDRTGKTVRETSRNPGGHQRNTSMPDGTSSSRTTRENSGPVARPGGRSPEREAGTGYTTGPASDSPDFKPVQSGPKITHISEP